MGVNNISIVMPRTPKPHVIMAIDFGGSLTKVIYQHRRGQPQLLTMPPEATVTTHFAIEEACSFTFSSTPPESICWVQPLDHEGNPIADEVGVVGDLGAQIAGFNSLNIAKNEKALYKLMGALSVIHQRLNNQGYKLKANFQVSIQCVLPSDEYKLSAHFETRLRYILSMGVLTPAGVIQPQLFSFKCYPEALSVARDFIAQHPHIQNAVVFMIGHRNTSAIIIREGRIKQFRNSMLGFHHCLEKACGSHGVSTKQINYAIFKAQHLNNTEPYAEITSYQDDVLRQTAGKELLARVHQAKKIYVNGLFEWFNNVIAAEPSPHLVFCGGGINSIVSALKDYSPKLYHHYGSSLTVPDTLTRDDLRHRLDDIYGLFLTFQDEFKFSAIQTDKASDYITSNAYPESSA